MSGPSTITGCGITRSKERSSKRLWPLAFGYWLLLDPINWLLLAVASERYLCQYDSYQLRRFWQLWQFWQSKSMFTWDQKIARAQKISTGDSSAKEVLAVYTKVAGF